MTDTGAPRTAPAANRPTPGGYLDDPDRRLRGVPRIAAFVVGVLATIAVMTSISPAFRHATRVPREYLDRYIMNSPDTSFAWALVLIMLALALASRKRVAWWIATIYLFYYWASGIALFVAIDVVRIDGVHLSSYVDSTAERIAFGVGLALQTAALGVLLAGRREFYARVRRAALLKAAIVLVVGEAVGTLLGWGLVLLAHGSLERGERLAYAFARVAAFVAFTPDQFDGRHPPGIVSTALGVMGAAILLIAAAVLFRSQRSANAITADDAALLRVLVDGYGAIDSLAYFSTRRDRSAVFAPNGLAAISYRVEVGTAIIGGDPVGDERHWADAIRAYRRVCDAYGWHQAAIGVSEKGAEAFAAHGFGALHLGDEAIMHTRAFTLSGPAMKPVRQAVTRCRRAGLTVRIRRHEALDADELAQMSARADSWRDTDEERGFSMALGRLGDPDDGRCLLVEAVADAGTDAERVVGMLSFVPWGQSGVSLDVMRRDREAPNGVVELMVSELALAAPGYGITHVSLNFAVFRSVFATGDRIGVGPVLKATHRTLSYFSRFYQLESLYRSNAKYHPQWVPRYLVFEGGRLVPRVALACGVAEGFLTLPTFSGRGDETTRLTGVRSSVPDGVDIDDVRAAAETARRQAECRARRPQQVRVRLDKLDRLRAAGVDPYPTAVSPTHTAAAFLSAPIGTRARIAGRVLRLRDFGGVTFAVLRDWSGDVQIAWDRGRLDALNAGPDAERPLPFAANVDLGDLVEVTGELGRTRSGELSLLADSWRMLGKCLYPLPDKWRGLTDPEARVRQRYVDFAIRAEARDALRARSAVVSALREGLASRDFLEVETPILQAVHGGANATPFRTHINAYDLDLYLRIAPELYLKRLAVGGVERVFELGRTFRNEGVDYSHNPEFTILEAYAAHKDYDDMRWLTQRLIQDAAIAAHGEPVVLRPNGDGFDRVDISGDWPVVPLYGAVSDAASVPVTVDTDVDALRAICVERGIPLQDEWGHGEIVLEMYERLVEEHTELPTFYTDFPASVSPLTRPHRSLPGLAERWDLVAWGVELGTAYSELTDPVLQRALLTDQSAKAAGGDAEAMELDEDFLTALEHAMPPTGGLGIGVDRVVMLVTGRSIRETLPFPLAKPR